MRYTPPLLTFLNYSLYRSFSDFRSLSNRKKIKVVNMKDSTYVLETTTGKISKM